LNFDEPTIVTSANCGAKVAVDINAAPSSNGLQMDNIFTQFTMILLKTLAAKPLAAPFRSVILATA
jgi:hypothetical protein